MSASAPPPPCADADLRALAQAFGVSAARVISLVDDGPSPDVVTASADILSQLFGLWHARDVAPEEVWMELDHRLQLGELLLRLQQDARRMPRRGTRAWHPASTKLP